MTPSARLSAAIAVLDRWLGGMPVEQALTNWARASRFAGSADRHAVRDLVFDAVRCRRSFGHLGGGDTGRGLILGGLRAFGADVAALFDGQGHAPAPLSAQESHRPGPPEGAVALDCPDWLAPALSSDLGDDFGPVMRALRTRAPVFLRANAARVTPAAAIEALRAEGVDATPHPLAPCALKVTGGARRVHLTRAYSEGLVEVQDAASQAVVAALPLAPGLRVLDYCAGGGGKALAMAAAGAAVTAHDANPARLRDLSDRATRAGTPVPVVGRPEGAWDLVLADVPCSGSGAWRRSPEGKWALTAERLAGLCATQADILSRAAALVVPGGWLGYVTCSLLRAENDAQADGFAAQHPTFAQAGRLRLTPLNGGDGFFLALFRRTA